MALCIRIHKVQAYNKKHTVNGGGPAVRFWSGDEQHKVDWHQGGLSLLRWDFERRRPYMTYHVLTAAAQVTADFIEKNGSAYGPTQYELFRTRLATATGLPWDPTEKGYVNIFRNYKRLLGGFEIATAKDHQLILLHTGRWIVENAPTEQAFYSQLIQRFKYPNSAFTSYADWLSSGRELSPLLLIIRTLVALGAPAQAFLTPDEVLYALYAGVNGLPNVVLREAILSYRAAAPAPSALPRLAHHAADDIDARQVREALFFLLQARVLQSPTHNLHQNSRLTLAETYASLAEQAQAHVATDAPRAFAVVEGAIFMENRRSRRRDARLREAVLARDGYHCAACGVDYSKYGERGRFAVDVHHLRPLSARTGNEETTLHDVLVLCATCHRMIHGGGELLTLGELRAILQRQR